MCRAGADIDERGRQFIRGSLTRDAKARAAKQFVLHGRDEQRSTKIGGDKVHLRTVSAAVQTLDLETGLYRSSTLQDLHNSTPLHDTLTDLSLFNRCCIATVVEDVFALDVNTASALVRNTTKPVAA